MKAIKIIDCTDRLMWYSKFVGCHVPYLRTEGDVFWSRERAGYSNIVRVEDGQLVDIDDTAAMYEQA